MGFVKENARSQADLRFLTLNVKNIIQITSNTWNITEKLRPFLYMPIQRHRIIISETTFFQSPKRFSVKQLHKFAFLHKSNGFILVKSNKIAANALLSDKNMI